MTKSLRRLVVIAGLVLGFTACAPDGNDADTIDGSSPERVDELEAQLAIANSRWLSAVATSAEHPPSVSRLLAVDAMSRSATPEAWEALGHLLFADVRRPPASVDVPHGAAVNVVAFSSDGSVLATGAGDGKVRLLRTGTWEVIAEMHHDDEVTALAFAADRSVLATSGRDGSAVLWDFDGERLLGVEHDDQVNDVAVSDDGSAIATASHDGTAKRATTEGDSTVFQHEGAVWAVDLTADGAVVATGAERGVGGVTTVWDSTGAVLGEVEHGKGVVAVAFSPDDTLLIAGDAGNSTELIDTAIVASVASPDAGDFGVSGVTWRRDGREVAVYALSGAVRVGSSTGTSFARLDQAGGERALHYGPDGEWAVVGSGDFAFSFGSIGVWDLGTGRRVVELNTGGPIEDVAYSSDGRWIAAGFRFADGSEVDGGLVVLPAPAQWVDVACESTNGVIDAELWVELTGSTDPFVPSCPGVAAPPPAPDLSVPDVSAP